MSARTEWFHVGHSTWTAVEGPACINDHDDCDADECALPDGAVALVLGADSNAVLYGDPETVRRSLEQALRLLGE